MDPLIITAAIVGGELTRKETPHLPVTAQEIAREALAAAAEGATVIHLHARDEKGVPAHRPELFAKIVEEIRKQGAAVKTGVPILQFSTGGSVGMSLKERLAPLALDPEMASLNTGTINFGAEVFENSQATMEAIAAELKKRKIRPEVEVFEAGMLDNAKALVKKGLLEEPAHFNFVLGIPGALGGEAENLIFLRSRLPAGASWGVAGIGRHQLPLAAIAIAIGGHVRVGLEDNIFYRKGELAEGNAPLVARIARLAKELDRPVATVAQARQLLRIRSSG